MVSEKYGERGALLEEISIRSLGVIDNATIEFKDGLNVITGETGAGKTMVLTALALILGAKSDPDLVRAGAERLSVSGRFVLPVKPAPALQALLVEFEPEVEEGALILGRSVTKDGKSRAILGSDTSTAGALQALGGELLEIHGQHGALSLNRPARQREILDLFGGAASRKLLTEYREAARRYRTLRDRLSQLKTATADRDALRTELSELTAAMELLKPRAGELGELNALIERLESIEELRMAASTALSALDDEESGARQGIGSARRALGSARGKDEELEGLAARVDELMYLGGDLASDLRGYLERLEVDPAALENALARRTALLTFAKRFGKSADRDEALQQAIESASGAKAQLADLIGGAERIGELEQEITAAFAKVGECAKELSSVRSKVAKSLSERVSEELSDLAMKDGRFLCTVTPGTVDDRVDSDSGYDQIEMLFTAHAGGELLPIAKAASGGELSRLMLALELSISTGTGVSTYLFDEVDAGIGGKAALEVGRRLKRLAENSQVIVVTHLPQVAVWADHHLRVLKDSSGAITQSSITTIAGQDREIEIARMLSGLSESEHAQEHARELLEMGRG